MTNKPQYRIQLFCPRCDKTAEAIGYLIPPLRMHCGDCLMDYVEIVEMKMSGAEQLPDEPMVELKIVGPHGEPIDEIAVPCIDGTENHRWAMSDDNENVCYCSRCGCCEY